jgi:hypothetical protein
MVVCNFLNALFSQKKPWCPVINNIWKERRMVYKQILQFFLLMWLPKKIVFSFHKRLNRPLLYSILSVIKLRVYDSSSCSINKDNLFISIKLLFVEMYFVQD